MGAVHQEQGELYCPICEQTFSDGERCPTDNTRLVRIAAPADTLLGRELDGRYTIVEKLGQGGMGAVYRGTQHSVGREVAIKVVAPQLVSDATVIKRFLREAKLASRLVHPNAVAVLDFGQTTDGLFYLVMELVDGRTLESVILEGPLPPQRLARVGMQICEALDGAHALKIIHRDLKPQNVMLMRTGRDLVKVLDFGIAKSLTPDSATVATMTNAGSLLGTPSYMPPELVGGRPVDARADLYSLGCLLFVAASGKLPFEADTVNELIAMHACEPAPPVVGVPPRLAAVIGRLLEKNPDDRFQSAAETRDALEAAYAGDSQIIAEVPPPLDEDEIEMSTRLGWSGKHTAREKGPRQRIATPIAGVPTKAPTPTSGRVITNRVSREEQKVVGSMPTLVASQEVPIPPAAPAAAPPEKKSRRGLVIGLTAASVTVVGVVTFLALRSPSATDTPPPPDHVTKPDRPPKKSATQEPAKSSTTPSAPTPAEPQPVEPPPTKPEPAPAAPAQTAPVQTPAKPDPGLTTPIPTPPRPNGNGQEIIGSENGTQPTAPKGVPKANNNTAKPKSVPTKQSPLAPKVEPKKEPDPPTRPITKNPGVM